MCGAVIDPLSFEFGAVGNVGLVVLRAGGNHHGTRGKRRPVVEDDFVRTAIAIEARDAVRDHHLGTEFFGLRDGARGELLPGQASRKPKIVFYLRARRGLPAGKLGLDYERVETFRCGVHRSGKARRAGADDDQVADVTFIDARVESETLGELLRSRAAKHLAADTADNNGNLVDSHLEA